MKIVPDLLPRSIYLHINYSFKNFIYLKRLTIQATWIHLLTIKSTVDSQSKTQYSLVKTRKSFQINMWMISFNQIKILPLQAACKIPFTQQKRVSKTPFSSHFSLWRKQQARLQWQTISHKSYHKYHQTWYLPIQCWFCSTNHHFGLFSLQNRNILFQMLGLPKCAT